MTNRDKDGMGRFEVIVEQGAARGGLYELEQTTCHRVIERLTGEVVMTFRGEMESSLSTETGMWEEYRYSGVREVLLEPGESAVIARYHDGREERIPLPG